MNNGSAHLEMVTKSIVFALNHCHVLDDIGWTHLMASLADLESGYKAGRIIIGADALDGVPYVITVERATDHARRLNLDVEAEKECERRRTEAAARRKERNE